MCKGRKEVVCSNPAAQSSLTGCRHAGLKVICVSNVEAKCLRGALPVLSGSLLKLVAVCGKQDQNSKLNVRAGSVFSFKSNLPCMLMFP